MVVRYRCQWAWLGGPEAVADVLVEVEGERIVAVTPAATPTSSDVVELHGLTLPGLANAHSHAFHRLLRGRTHAADADSFWSWRTQMYEVAASLDPDSSRAIARAVYGEMALAGITAVGEFHYVHHRPDGTPYDEPNVMADALANAADAAGIRLTLLDACYLHGDIGVAPDATQQRFSDGSAEAWAARTTALADAWRDHPRRRVGAAIHSVRAVDPDSMAVVAAWAAERDAPLHAHVSEQPAEHERTAVAYGMTPLAVLERAGALGERFTAVHGTHFDPADIARLGATGGTCCLCPTTERELADGIGPAGALADAGVRLTLGSDAHAVIDLLEEARAVELHERLLTNRRGRFDPAALLTAATADGHAGLGWPDAGRLAPGARADLVTIGGDSVRTAGMATDPLGVAVFAATAADVRHVVVDGDVIVRDGRHLHLDVAAELRAVLS